MNFGIQRKQDVNLWWNVFPPSRGACIFPCHRYIKQYLHEFSQLQRPVLCKDRNAEFARSFTTLGEIRTPHQKQERAAATEQGVVP